MSQLPARSEVPVQATWNAESVFGSIQEWESEYEAVLAEIPKIHSFRGLVSQSTNKLAEVLSICDVIRARIGKLGVYSYTSYGVDTNNQAAARIDSKTATVHSRFSAACSFIAPEILAAGEQILSEISEIPGLEVYRHYLENLFRSRPHVRSSEVEEVLGMVGEPFAGPETTYTMLTSAEIVFEQVKDSKGTAHRVFQGTIGAQMHSDDAVLRRNAWESFADQFLAFKGTIASNYLTAVKQDVFKARARGFESSLDAALFGNNIPVSVFTTLIDVFEKHLPVWHRYWKVRRKALGLSVHGPYDIWAPIARQQPVIPLQKGIDWICQGMAPLGKEYVDALRTGCLTDRWLDCVPNMGKRAGAWSGGSLGTHPFIVMGYNDDLASMSTLAHELGHSMHSYLTWKTQPPIYADYSIFAAEVASNFDQALVRSHLLELHKSDSAFQIALIEEAMSNFHRYLFIMPTLARFELQVHTRVAQGKSMAADDLNDIMYELFAQGYGGEVAGDKARIGITWAQFPHLYMPFYVFQYATGISAAHALADQVSRDSGAATRYLDFLKAGSSRYPTDALKAAGCDLTVAEPIERAFATLAAYVDRLEQLTAG